MLRTATLLAVAAAASAAYSVGNALSATDASRSYPSYISGNSAAKLSDYKGKVIVVDKSHCG